jgi:hypothetical protein
MLDKYNYIARKPGTKLQDWLYDDKNYTIDDETPWLIDETETKIWAKDHLQAQRMAKLIYSTEYELNNID